MNEIVKVACVQAEPVVLDKAATIDKLEGLVAEAAGEGARLALFPETFIPVYPSSRWVRFLAGGGDAKTTFGRLARESVEVPGPDTSGSGRSRASTRSGSRSASTSARAGRSTTRCSSSGPTGRSTSTTAS